MRHRYFVRTQCGVIKIKSLSYNYSYGNVVICILPTVDPRKTWLNKLKLLKPMIL
ncbi:hypothetical protein ARSQ2_02451 [Arsenophonus endosymbiont of Bemisia tabaci Q2]|nr:hypothetical protein ARSQ2_02451 [Arsenophonus endosymbiont of Bemisia tabaci Q2]